MNVSYLIHEMWVNLFVVIENFKWIKLRTLFNLMGYMSSYIKHFIFLPIDNVWSSLRLPVNAALSKYPLIS